MVKLTPELVSRASSHINPLKERELEFRGLGIATIENLGAVQGGYDCLNFSDNALTTLANVPLSTRLRSVIAANNRISSISSALSASIPNLTTLTLTGNSITLLSSLVPLESCTNLRYLSLGGNPVCNEEHYRSFALWKVAGGQLHVLDFQRVKDAERVAAKDLFLTAGPDRQPNALAATLCASTASTSVGAVDGEKAAGGAKGGRQMTAEDKEKVKKAILAADSTDEMRRLEKMLASGVVPGDHDL